jgi:alpha,alpha-trehalase
MVDNFGYLIDSLGFVPNGNKNYYLSRSQPPFFSLMLNVLAEEDPSALVRYLPAMQKEYEFWMDGETELEKPGDAVEHVVMLSNGGIVNRYWDSDPRPRPESYKEDVHVQVTSKREAEDLYRNLRSACESGWDFSTRWFEEGKGIESIRTTEIIPVDLNCLLYHHEQMLAKAYSATDQNKAAYYRDRADKRRRAILTFMWDPEQNYFFDYHFPSNQRSHALTLAGVFPLYVNMVQPEIAQAVATRLQDDFLMPGGLRTTLVQSGQQWDAPNGWAPLQWMAYGGLRNYGLNSLADAIKNRWLSINTKVYFATGKMMEKYNVADTTLIAGGGEYPNQDGFGWTNGVFLAMKRYEPQSLSIKK